MSLSWRHRADSKLCLHLVKLKTHAWQRVMHNNVINCEILCSQLAAWLQISFNLTWNVVCFLFSFNYSFVMWHISEGLSCKSNISPLYKPPKIFILGQVLKTEAISRATSHKCHSNLLIHISGSVPCTAGMLPLQIRRAQKWSFQTAKLFFITAGVTAPRDAKLSKHISKSNSSLDGSSARSDWTGSER